jgi:hypothetical protein
MGSGARKLRRSLMERELRSSAPKKTLDELLAEAVVSLKAVPLEERRKEASKPLFLTRYE